MMETHNQHPTKEILLKASREILRLRQRSLNMIRDRKMYHTKLIERSSKCTKDPNPLATTMILLNQKYPLAISKPEARKYGVPNHYLYVNGKKEIEDSHMQNHVLAKLETIHWWVSNSSVPSGQLKKLADVLFKNLDNQCRAYYEVNWRATRIQWGPPTLQRDLVRTNKPVVEVPCNLRAAALKEIFFPDFSSTHPRITSGTIAELRNHMDVAITDNMPLTK
ncbi:unnamed protein product [Chilo suppressalis]|uniref:Uncharacterized protein n=1 Tax=Chilo suppressalis TaxID=168631 RepID=A0ABN8AZQ3_CHISP|nr:unnamed protein product [Chilo suppressalis]